MKGGFIEQNSGVPKEEKSFLIVNFKRGSKVPEKNTNELKALAIDLCDKYRHDSVLVVEPGKNPTYYKKDGSVDFTLGDGKAVRDYITDYLPKLEKTMETNKIHDENRIDDDKQSEKQFHITPFT